MSQNEPSRPALWLAHFFGWSLSKLSSATRKSIADAVFPEGAARTLDPMTRLFTQAEFLLARTAADADPDVTYVLFDVTRQGEVNDYHGQDAGDALIMAAASAVREAAATYGTTRVFRRGGDESAVLASPATATLIAKGARIRLAERLAGGEPLRDTKGGLHPSAIFQGHELYAVTGQTFSDADRKLRQAKASYRLFGVIPEPDLRPVAHSSVPPAVRDQVLFAPGLGLSHV